MYFVRMVGRKGIGSEIKSFGWMVRIEIKIDIFGVVVLGVGCIIAAVCLFVSVLVVSTARIIGHVIIRRGRRQRQAIVVIRVVMIIIILIRQLRYFIVDFIRNRV